jgi:uncharacterized phage-associated protein
MVDKKIKLSFPDSAGSPRSGLRTQVDSAKDGEDQILLESDQLRILSKDFDIRVSPNATITKRKATNEVDKNKPNAHDVAAFILQQKGEMTAMKLQKLVYYSQAWSLVWDEEPLFDEEIQAWANGPVVPALYSRHQGLFKLREWNGTPEKLTETQRETILKVLEFYGDMPSQTLSSLTHQEDPWLKAREGLGIGERGNRVISLSDMAEYYSSL